MTPRKLEQIVDRIVRSALQVDPAYRYAETPEEKQERKEEIVRLARKGVGDDPS